VGSVTVWEYGAGLSVVNLWKKEWYRKTHRGPFPGNPGVAMASLRLASSRCVTENSISYHRALLNHI